MRSRRVNNGEGMGKWTVSSLKSLTSCSYTCYLKPYLPRARSNPSTEACRPLNLEINANYSEFTKWTADRQATNLTKKTNEFLRNLSPLGRFMARKLHGGLSCLCLRVFADNVT